MRTGGERGDGTHKLSWRRRKQQRKVLDVTAMQHPQDPLLAESLHNKWEMKRICGNGGEDTASGKLIIC